MAQAEKLTGIVLSALAILYVYLATEYPYGLSHGVPGPGTLPVILGILLFLFSLGCTLRSSYWVEGEKKIWTGDTISLLTCLAFYLAYVITIQSLGFLLATFLYGLLTLKWLFRLEWLSATLYSLVLTALFHTAFYNLLGVPLPRGLSWKILEALSLLTTG